MKRSTRNILLAVVAVFLLLVVLFLYNLFGPSPAIVVSPNTTWLTEPLAEDGLPDYARYLLDQQREGVTPENNAAIPFLTAMWPAELEPEHQAVVCAAVGMETPETDGFVEPWYDTEEVNSVTRDVALMLLAMQGITPSQEINSKKDYVDWSREWWESDAEQRPTRFIEPTVDGEYDFGFEMGSQDPFDRAETRASELVDQCMDEPWTAEQVPPLKEWVDRNAANYDLLYEAARRPKYYFPSALLVEDSQANLFTMLLPDIQSSRSAIRVLSVRAMLRMGEKDYSGAWEDCQAMYLLADHVPVDTVVGQLVRIACHGVADGVTEQLLNDLDLPTELAKRIHAFLASRPQPRTMSFTIDSGERLFSITAILDFSGARRGDSTGDLDELLGGAEVVAIDWNVVLERMNVAYDQMVAAMEIEDYQQREQALSQFEAKLSNLQPAPGKIAKSVFSRSARSEVMADMLAGLLLPAVTAASAAEDRANSQLRLLQVAAALAVYRAEHGDYPDSLEALIPSLIPKPPVDLYHGKPLSYTKTETGYLLVELGPNGVDDGGSNQQSTQYLGYTVTDYRLDAVLKLLGESPLDEGETIDERIPPSADDWAIRMPLPEADWSLLENSGEEPKPTDNTP